MHSVYPLHIPLRYKYSVDEELEKLNNINAKFYTEDDEEYPEKLKYIPDAPLGI